jgi:glutamate 5-kinase
MDNRSSAFQRIIIKLGTSTLTGGTPYLSPPRIVDLVRQIAELHARGVEIGIVSSGAMAAGKEKLNFPLLPKQIPAKQMLAAIGQPRLMNLYAQLFELFNITVAQVLLTRADIENRRSYLNARNSLQALLEQQVLPVINENDTVATEEIRLGDNDNLSAQVANLIEADLLLMLTDQPGIFTADPRTSPDAKMIREVTSDEIPEVLWKAAGGTVNELGTGGMITKLQAADLARRSGTTVVVARGSDPDVILQVVNGAEVGTWFFPVNSGTESRKRYILMSGRLENTWLTIDDGAVRALQSGGSLLPIGIVSCEGEFERGDVIRVRNSQEREIARGVTNYNHHQLKKIIGQHSQLIEEILGFTYGDEVIHRNDMVML